MHQFTFIPAKLEGFNFIPINSYVCIFWFSHPRSKNLYLILVLTCIFLIINYVGIFLYTYWLFVYLLWRKYIQFFAYFLKCVICFHFWVLRLLMYSGYRSFISFMVSKDFLPFCVFFFFLTFLMVLFAAQEF